ncbi:MAG: outer membrane lipoprotein carrier protein LolA, partial [Ignavibacteria bacterium]|nr:outer membrane lipoprotein carrier protein LolA [Ignavibacteria bacterium]
MKIKFLVAIFFLPVLMLAQGNALLKKIQNKYKSVNDFTSGLVQYNYSTSGTVMSKTNGTITYKRKNKFVVELGNHTIVSDGVNIWNHDKKFKRVVISSLTDDPTSFSLERYLYDYPA